MSQRTVPAHTSDDVVRLARTWIGTPYHHQASLKHVGTDCLGLVRGVWRELYGVEAEGAPAYAGDWAEATRQETLLNAAKRHLLARPAGTMLPGDVVVFRYRSTMVAKHMGIAASDESFVHAIEGRRVSEVAFSDWWRRRIAGVFQFPGVLS